MEEEAPEEFTSVKFAQMILELTEANWVDADEFEKFVDKVRVPPGPARVDFIQRLNAMFKRLPDKLVDVETKTKIIEAGQEYLDKAIDEEEEMLEEMEELADSEDSD